MMKSGFYFHLLKSLVNVRMKREKPFFPPLSQTTIKSNGFLLGKQTGKK